MEEEIYKEKTKAEVQDLVNSHPPVLPREPYTWLMITDGEKVSERHIFYNITEDHYYVRFVPELRNKYVACCYGGWLVLRDKNKDNCSILNILTMKKLQLPRLGIHPYKYPFHIECVMSSPKMDGSCRVIFFRRNYHRFWSCHLGDKEFIERNSMYNDESIIRNFINFKGKLYALTKSDWDLIVSNFSDPHLHHKQVVCGKSLKDIIFTTDLDVDFYLVESCEDLLLIYMSSCDYEVSDVKIFKADFGIREWVQLETLGGDRAIFLGPHNNNYSSPATLLGMKGNAIYWIRPPSGCTLPERHLYMYDMEDKSISMSLPFPTVGTYSLSWLSFPMVFSKEKKPKRKGRSSLFKVSPTETNFHVQRQKTTIASTELQILQRKLRKRKREETEAIDSTIVKKESLWADLPNELIVEIFSHLFVCDIVAFRLVCRSWYSVSPSRTSHQILLPLKSSGCSSPFLMLPDNETYHPIHGELYSVDFPDVPGTNVRAARDGWLLMDHHSVGLFFYNPLTRAEIILPGCNARFYYSVYFSAPPTSADCFIVAAVKRLDLTCAICFKKYEDVGWTRCKISPEKESFCFAYSNAVVYKGLYHFFGDDAKLFIFNPRNKTYRVIKPPNFISELMAKGGQQYMLEGNGKLIAVFVSTDGSSVYTCAWNGSVSKWDIIKSLGNTMLFVSRQLSICKRATIRGTGNKSYFPRVVDDGQILFYSLATKRYHTFEMGTSYSNFFASKFYPRYNGWFMC